MSPIVALGLPAQTPAIIMIDPTLPPGNCDRPLAVEGGWHLSPLALNRRGRSWLLRAATEAARCGSDSVRYVMLQLG